MKLIRNFYTLGLALAIQGLQIDTVKAQDPVFSQWHASPILINPGFTGISEGPSFGLNYRNQWPGLNQAYVTYAATYDQFISKYNSGIGFVLVTDNAGQGLLKTNRVALDYSYRLKVKKGEYLKLGLEFGFINTQLGWNRLIFLDQIDPVNGLPQPGGTVVFPPSSETAPDQLAKTKFDVSAGVLYYGKRFFGGVSAKHLNSPDDRFLNKNPQLATGLPVRFSGIAGMNIGIGEPTRGKYDQLVLPHLLLVKQGPFFQALAGVIYQYHKFYMGVEYRQTRKVSDALILEAGIETGIFRFGYSYDTTISSTLGGRTGGAHEISIVIHVPEKKANPISDCFQFFR